MHQPASKTPPTTSRIAGDGSGTVLALVVIVASSSTNEVPPGSAVSVTAEILPPKLTRHYGPSARETLLLVVSRSC